MWYKEINRFKSQFEVFFFFLCGNNLDIIFSNYALPINKGQVLLCFTCRADCQVQVSKPLWIFDNIFKSFVAEPADNIENLAQVWEVRNLENGILKTCVPLAMFEYGILGSEVWFLLETHTHNSGGLVANTSFATGWGLGSCSSWWEQERTLWKLISQKIMLQCKSFEESLRLQGGVVSLLSGIRFISCWEYLLMCHHREL